MGCWSVQILVIIHRLGKHINGVCEQSVANNKKEEVTFWRLHNKALSAQSETITCQLREM